MNIARLLTFTCAGALSLGAQAVDLFPSGAFVQGAIAEHGTYSVTLGALWPWSWRREALGGELSAATELYLSYWDARRASGGRQGFTQVALVPMFRYRPSGGRSAWFLEAGIGISGLDTLFENSEKKFSSSFNFVDAIAVGRSFGAMGRQELSLRLTHFSNAGLKRPNPGENFLQVRYAAMF